MKTVVWKKDWLVGVLITLAVALLQGTSFLQSLERNAYDFGVASTERRANSRIAVVAIDDDSIAEIGRWPWSRDVHASLIDALQQVKIIGNTVLFLEPQVDPGLQGLGEISSFLASSSLQADLARDVDRLKVMMEELLLLEEYRPSEKSQAINRLSSYFRSSALNNDAADDVAVLRAMIDTLERRLASDQILAESLGKNAKVILASYLEYGEIIGNPDNPLPGYIENSTISRVRLGTTRSAASPLTSTLMLPPIPALGEVSAAIGHISTLPDIDGAIRKEPLIWQYYDRYIPSLSLLLAARSLNLDVGDVSVSLGEGVQLGNLYIATDPLARMNTFFYSGQNGRPVFPVDSFSDVINGKVPPEKFRDKIVLIGTTAAGISTPKVTPVSAQMPAVLMLAHAVSSILNEDFFVEPEWGRWVSWGALMVVAIYLILVLPRLGAALAAISTLILLAGLFAGHYVLMTQHTLWVKLMTAATLLVLGHLLLTTKRYLVTEKGKLRSEAESAETNRALGLAFQERGQLDMAFEKFRKCPVDDSMLDVLYNLGLDFERKRQFSKSVSVYQIIAETNKGFRDVSRRMEQARAAEKTVVFGAKSGATGTLVLDNAASISKPMLGRYQVEKELGRGAMGIVYLGRDPKIDRVVAIKTMDLLQGVEQEEQEEVKARFFREAKAAGRLRHPNIVTIYDAGEEHDLAYIAMEFLKGRELTEFTRFDSLLPLPTALHIVLKAAEALDYAHHENVVHRDIKPGNIMYEPKSGTVKITDFGIARITDASKTKTGTVMGTPSYMSPEQISGRKVDGRSDLFSLGVMMFQLISGKLPFKADTLTNLMYKIANERHPDILTLRTDLPPAGACISRIVDNALKKQPEQRYQTGRDFAEDVRSCAKKIAGKV